MRSNDDLDGRSARPIAHGSEMLITDAPDIDVPATAETESVPQDGRPTPMTVVITWRVVPGREAVFEEWAHGITEAGRRYLGHLGSNWFRLGDRSNRYRTVIKFSDERALRHWMDSPERHDWLRRVEGYTRRSEERLTGMETWFTLPGAATPVPARWKMFLVTVICSYIVSLTINLLLQDVLSAVPLAVRVLITTVLLVGALTWPILPNVTRLLRRFLYPRDEL
ncbi:MAG TPA: antibiotic biosynthesis monooxygenase [Thermomicrobiales bacterium]|jgi:hypothetical protein|nr:antibiotic biosynthesis monooxygenase [Thermomicrobiales bacterium]